MKQAGITV